MPVRVDLPGLLKLLDRLEFSSLPFVVKPAGRLTGRPAPAAFLSVVRGAIADANQAAVSRNPNDPLWSIDGGLSPDGVLAEVQKGSMQEGDITAWFGDLARALEPVNATVQPAAPPRTEPNFFEWSDFPAPLTAFLDFTPRDRHARFPLVPVEVVLANADFLAAWARLPGGMASIGRGDGISFLVRPDRVADELRQSAEVDEQHSVWEFTAKPRRLRVISFGLNARLSLQDVNEQTAARSLPSMLDALRQLGPWLENGRVRRAPLGHLLEQATHRLGRDPSPAEELAADYHHTHLLGDYAVDAYVAQVLTASHLRRLGKLNGYNIEPLGHDRFLVTADDPEPWLSEVLPDPVTLTQARSQFSAAQLTPEVAAANLAPWQT